MREELGGQLCRGTGSAWTLVFIIDLTAGEQELLFEETGEHKKYIYIYNVAGKSSFHVQLPKRIMECSSKVV